MATRKSARNRLPNGPVQASIYCRISLDAKGDGAGVERQEQECRELCQRNGWEIAEVFVDNDVSAYSGKRRPRFEALLASNPQVIVVWHTDRLVRLTADLDRVIELGVNVYSVTAGDVDLSNPAGRAVAKTIVTWAQYESEQKAERQRAAGRQRASKGRPWWGSRPFGYERDGTLRNTEADALRSAYEGVLAGRSVASLARELSQLGHVTTFGKPWGPASLRPVLLNARNAGIREYEGEEVGPANWSPIVDEQTYRSACRILRSPSRGRGGNGPAATSLLTGIATCGVCGSGVKQNRRYHWKDRNQSYSVYVCKRSSCASVPTEYVDGRVWMAITDVLPDPEFQSAWLTPLPGDDRDGADPRTEHHELTVRLDHAAEDYAAGLLTRQQLVTITEVSRVRLGELEELMAAKSTSYDLGFVLGDLDYVYETIDTMPLAEQRALVTTVIESVQILPRAKGTKSTPRECVAVTVRSPNDMRQLPTGTERVSGEPTQETTR